MKVMRLSNYKVKSPNFKAHLPNTLGKKSADALAKEFLASEDKDKVEFANKYLNSIKKLEQTQEIKEVLFQSTGKRQSLLYDGLDLGVYGFDYAPIRETLDNKEKKRAFNTMNYLISDVENLPTIVQKVVKHGQF